MEFPTTEISYINELGQEKRGQTYIVYCCVGCKNGIQLGRCTLSAKRLRSRPPLMRILDCLFWFAKIISDVHRNEPGIGAEAVVMLKQSGNDSIIACYNGWTNAEFEQQHRGVSSELCDSESTNTIYPRTKQPIVIYWKPSSPPFKWKVGSHSASTWEQKVLESEAQTYPEQQQDTFTYYCNN